MAETITPTDNKELKGFYDRLDANRDNMFKNLPSYDEFKDVLSDENERKGFYDRLVITNKESKVFKNLPEYNEFSSVLFPETTTDASTDEIPAFTGEQVGIKDPTGIEIPYLKSEEPTIPFAPKPRESYEDYKQRLNKLQRGLGDESPLYNLRGAYEGELEPILEEDGKYHLGSRNPLTGEILKHKNHPTYDKMLKGEEEAGYEIYEVDGKEYSRLKDKGDDEIYEEAKAKEAEEARRFTKEKATDIYNLSNWLCGSE